MAENNRRQPLTDFAQVGRVDLRRAILSGRRDGRRRLHCPGKGHAAYPTPGEFTTVLGDPKAPVTTPYIDAIHRHVEVAHSQLTEVLHATQRTLRDQTYRRADEFVRLYEAGRPTRGACGRFHACVVAWNGLLHDHHKDLVKAVDNANYLIARYWETLQANHWHPWRWSGDRQPLCRILTPKYVGLDPTWVKPDHFLLIRYGRAARLDDETGADGGAGLDDESGFDLDTGLNVATIPAPPRYGRDTAGPPDDDPTDDPTAYAAWVLRRALELLAETLKNPYPDDLDGTARD